jgi:peptidyl-prolyl cis-trans isomerase D
LSYVFFEKKPSQTDEEETKNRLLEIREEILAGEDFGDMALDYSEDKGSAKDSGDLGWFAKGMMVPDFEEVAFSLEPGQISDPVKTQFGWHLIKVEEKRDKDEKQEVRARHILLKVSPSEETLTLLKESADEFVDQVNKSNFSQMAEERNLSVSETGWFVQGGYIPVIGKNQQVDEFAFGNDENDISDLIETVRGFYVFQIKAKRPAGISPLEEAKQNINRELVKIQADSLAYVKAEKIYEQLKNGKSLKKAAEESNATYSETDEFSRSSNIPNIGKLPEFIGKAFSLTEPNQISPPVKTRLGTFIIQLLSRTAVDDSLFAAVKDSISYTVLQKKQNETYQNWFAQVKKEAIIKDYRSEYFREY